MPKLHRNFPHELTLVDQFKPFSLSNFYCSSTTKQSFINFFSIMPTTKLFLISGKKGVGKNTLAWMIGYLMNCEEYQKIVIDKTAKWPEGKTAEPCGKCKNCKLILRSTKGNLGKTHCFDASKSWKKTEEAIQNSFSMTSVHGKFSTMILDHFDKFPYNRQVSLIELIKECKDLNKQNYIVFIVEKDNRIQNDLKRHCQTFALDLPTYGDMVNMVSDLQKEMKWSDIAKEDKTSFFNKIKFFSHRSVLRATEKYHKEGFISVLQMNGEDD